MHPNPIYRKADAARNLGFARARGFGTLAVNGPEGPHLSHIPFLLSEDGTKAEFHLVRSNPIARALKDGAQPAALAVTGPEGYVSPDWYGIADQVPTWNYVAVHLRGPVILRPQGELRGLLDRLSTRFEADLLPKTPWSAGKMTPEPLERMMRQIVPAEMEVASVDGTWKLNQNKDDAVRLAAADHLEAAALAPEAQTLAALMRAAKAE